MKLVFERSSRSLQMFVTSGTRQTQTRAPDSQAICNQLPVTFVNTWPRSHPWISFPMVPINRNRGSVHYPFINSYLSSDKWQFSILCVELISPEIEWLIQATQITGSSEFVSGNRYCDRSAERAFVLYWDFETGKKKKQHRNLDKTGGRVKNSWESEEK